MRRLFLTLVRRVGAEFEAGVAELLADLDQRGGQAPQALALLDLGLGAGGVGGGDGARGLLAIAIEQQDEVGAVTGMALLVATAGRRAALEVLLAQGAGTQVAEGGDLVEDAGASLLQAADGGGKWQVGPSALLY